MRLRPPLCVPFMLSAILCAAQPQPAPTLWSFDTAPTGAPPTGFIPARAGIGAMGKWRVKAEKDAPSPPNALYQLEADPNRDRFPMMLTAAPVDGDFTASLKCKPMTGKLERACGLVFRSQDPDDYYVVRASALSNDLALLVVKDGKARKLKVFKAKVSGDAWHAIEVRVEGTRIEVRWEGKRVMTVTDPTFTGSGRVGLWTAADTVAGFDDLVVREGKGR